MSKAKVKQNASACQFRPEGELTIYTAAESKNELMKVLEKCKALEIDLAKVSEFDSAGLQILAMAKKESQQRNIELTIVGHSEAVIDVLDICNVTGYFGDPLLLPH